MRTRSVNSLDGCWQAVKWLCLTILCSGQWAAVAADDAGRREYFEKRIRPVLVEHCYQCHSVLSKEVKGGLLVDHRSGLLKGGESGPAIVIGKADESLLLSALKHDGLKMPPDRRLPERVLQDFQQWINDGAFDPRQDAPDVKQATNRARAEQFSQLATWWSLQPLPERKADQKQTPSPAAIDEFIWARLKSEGLTPVAAADRRTLVRRLYFLLLGLPPTPREVDEFVQDSSSLAWSRCVERVLASPHFGEHWARHWMDVVRYSDTYGYEWDMPAKGAWRYRDYLVRAFNQDVPFDQLVREQIAGDLLPEPRLNATEQINESLIGPMFFQMGEKRHGDSSEFDGIHQEMLDNKIDAFGKAFQALTISCARCHDHKVDAVHQREYYALAGVFMSSRWITNTVDLPTRDAELRRTLTQIKQELRSEVARLWQEDIGQWRQSTTFDAAFAAREKELAGKDIPLEDWLHVWVTLKRAQASGADLTAVWKGLAERYGAETKKRQQENSGHFAVVADLRNELPAGWSIDGVGVRERVALGDFTVALEGDAVVGQILHGGLVTHSLSPRMNGAVRTPWLNTLPPGHLSVELAGGDFACRRAVIDNAFLTEKQQYINSRHPQWVRLDTFGSMPERHVYLEFATKTSNPNFPPRVGLGGACNEAQAADPRSWFAISRIVRHQAPFTPFDELTRFDRLFVGEPVRTLDEVLDRYRQAASTAVAKWNEQQATDDDVKWLNWCLDTGLLRNAASKLLPELVALRDRYRAVERQLAEPWTVNGLADLEAGFDYRLHDRGDYDKLRDPVPRGYLEVLSNGTGQSSEEVAQAFRSERSGRLTLAHLIASPRNPLTARVYVNRVWQWLFGRGLVASTNDFGHLGEQPSHPELLDDLTQRFLDSGWSTKQLVRAMLLSETWRQSSQPEASALAADPANRHWHHFPVRRLEAESIRDAMLAVSGRLDRALGGPTINPHRLNEDPEKRLFSGPIDGQGRRSLYIKATIMEPPRFLALFNQPPPKIPTGTRDVSNTPAQSLAMLNDPFVSEMAEAWAARLCAPDGKSSDETVASRLQQLFQSAYGRPATDSEVARWTSAVNELAALNRTASSEVLTSVPLWRQVTHALFNTKEFVYLR